MGLVERLNELRSRRISLVPLRVHTQNTLKGLAFSCLLVFSGSSCSSSDAGTSLSNFEILNCQNFLLGVDAVVELGSSLGLDNELTLLEKLQFIGTPTSQKLDAWDTFLGKQFSNLESFGAVDNKELSKLVFDVKRKYVTARIRFTTAKTFQEILVAFEVYTDSSNELERFCEKTV